MEKIWKSIGFGIMLIVMLAITTAGALAENWYISSGLGGLPTNFSATMNQGFYYQYAGNSSNLTTALNACSASDRSWASTTTCVQPAFSNRTDFPPFTTNGFLWWHPSSTKGGAQLVFNAPVDNYVYFFNVSFFKYTGGNNVNFSVKREDGTVIYATTLAGGATASTTGSVNLSLGEKLLFIAETPDSDAGDSSGILLNISSRLNIVPIPAPTWEAPTPSSGARNNTQVTLNASCSPGNTTYMWFDSSNPPTTLVVNNASLGNYTTNVGSSTATYYYIAACNSAGAFSDNTSVRTWIYDAVFPAITLGANNAFNAQNYSTENQFDDTAYLNITFSDDAQLYAMEVNVTAPNGSSVFDIVQTNLSGTSYVYTALLNTSTWTEGTYNFELFVSDSHTAREIQPYEVNKDNKKVEFKTAEGHDITIETSDSASIGATKKLDRYEFSFDFDDGISKKRTFDVKSSSDITYLPDSKYKAHFVVYENHKGNWIDFEGVPGTPEIKKISDKHYQVIFQSLKKADFRSIGGLNVYTANFTWYHGSYDEQSPGTAAATEPSLLTLLVTTDSSISDIDAGLAYNNTVQSGISKSSNSTHFIFTKTVTAPNASGTVPILWNLSVTQGDGNKSYFNVSATQLVAFFGIDACTASNTTTMNITIYNEDIPSEQIVSSLALEIETWQSNRSNSRFFSTNLTGQSSYRLCIFPTYGNVSADVYIQNTANGSLTHRYYAFGDVFTNVTQNVSLYNFLTPTTGLSDLRITTRYVETYKYFANVVAKLQRRYLAEGVWRTVQMDKSGDFGLVDFDIKERSVDYRLIFLDVNNTVLRTTDSLKFACTDNVCELTQLLNPSGDSGAGNPTLVSVEYSNVTGVLTANWTQTGGDNVNVGLLVTRETGSRSTTLCQTNQTGSAGTITCNASGLTGTAYFIFNSDGVPVDSGFIDLAGTKLGVKVGNAEGALWAVAIIITIVMVGLFSPAGSVIAAVIGLVIVNLLGLFTPLTLTFILVAAVMGIIIGIKVKQ